MNQVWLTQKQFAKIAPYRPSDTRGKERVDDRQVISGIVHVLKDGKPLDGRGAGCLRTKVDPLQPLRALSGQRRLGWHVRDAGPGRGDALPSADRLHRRESTLLRRRGQRGQQNQAIGSSRGGRTTKIHSLADCFCRPIAFMLTGGQAVDCKAGALLIERLPASRIVLADEGYDSAAIPRQIGTTGAATNIFPRSIVAGSRASPP